MDPVLQWDYPNVGHFLSGMLPWSHETSQLLWHHLGSPQIQTLFIHFGWSVSYINLFVTFPVLRWTVGRNPIICVLGSHLLIFSKKIHCHHQIAFDFWLPSLDCWEQTYFIQIFFGRHESINSSRYMSQSLWLCLVLDFQKLLVGRIINKKKNHYPRGS